MKFRENEDAVSPVIGVILIVLANTMAMNARERRGEYAVLKTMGFKARHLAGLFVGGAESAGEGHGLEVGAVEGPRCSVCRLRPWQDRD